MDLGEGASVGLSQIKRLRFSQAYPDQYFSSLISLRLLLFYSKRGRGEASCAVYAVKKNNVRNFPLMKMNEEIIKLENYSEYGTQV